MKIDARNLTCPKPVVMTLEALPKLAAGESLEVVVNDEVAVGNLTRLAAQKDCELATAVQHHVPIKVIVINNHSLGMVLEHQDLCYKGNRYAVELGSSPDITALAAACGLQAQRIAKADQCAEAIDRLLEADGPALLECVISPEETTP